MSVRRVMGIETEYGISVPGEPHANPMLLSGQVVHAYAQLAGIPRQRATWDYTDEAPLQDARGFEMGRALAHPTQLTDDPTMANVVLPNGARLYVDHAHPEYSSPEVTTPRDAVTWDRAGELVMAAAAHELAAAPPGVNLYKNNTDGKGASYGTHENYLLRRSTDFREVVRHLTPFFVVRQILCGSGRVGLGTHSQDVGFQISQRSDFFETEVGLETTLKRPIINTRDEPHATPERWRRLHVILGDANHADVANLLKLGTTSLVLGMIEDGFITRDLSLRDPVGTLRRVSHDPALQQQVELADGRSLRGTELLWEYLHLADAWLTQVGGRERDHDTAEVMHWWERVLTLLEDDPMSAAREVDWVAKLAVLQGYRRRDSLEWGDPRLRALDIQWSDVRPEKGVAQKLLRAGRLEQLVDDADVRRAVTSPPEDTRAYFRGRCVEKFGTAVVAASWDSVVFEVPGEQSLRRVPMPEPERGTAAHVARLIDSSDSVEALLDTISDARTHE